jgi:hypothetical protein
LKPSTQLVLLLIVLIALCPVVAQGKESVITDATAYVIQGEPVNVHAVAINEELNSQKPLTLLLWRSASRRWMAVGSSHAIGELGTAKVNGNKVMFTYSDSQSLDPGMAFFGTTRRCTANGICPQDVEPDAAVRVVIAREVMPEN